MERDLRIQNQHDISEIVYIFILRFILFNNVHYNGSKNFSKNYFKTLNLRLTMYLLILRKIINIFKQYLH